MKAMTCSECNYCWKSENDKYACCHYERIADWDLTPCEQEPNDCE